MQILSQDKDVFLMVKDSQTDWITHKNDGINAAGAGLNFAEKGGRTRVIITANHETGGCAALGGLVGNKTVNQTGFHTAAMVPLFAYASAARCSAQFTITPTSAKRCGISARNKNGR